MSRSVGLRHGEDDDEIRDGTLADEPLAAVDDIGLATGLGAGSGTRRGGVGAGLGLGEGERDQVLPAGQLREPARLLLGRARPA